VNRFVGLFLLGSITVVVSSCGAGSWNPVEMAEGQWDCATDEGDRFGFDVTAWDESSGNVIVTYGDDGDGDEYWWRLSGQRIEVITVDNDNGVIADGIEADATSIEVTEFFGLEPDPRDFAFDAFRSPQPRSDRTEENSLEVEWSGDSARFTTESGTTLSCNR